MIFKLFISNSCSLSSNTYAVASGAPALARRRLIQIKQARKLKECHRQVTNKKKKSGAYVSDVLVLMMMEADEL